MIALLSKKYSSVLLLSFFAAGLFLFVPDKAEAACNISSIAVRPHGTQPISLTTVASPNDFPGENNPYRDQAHGYPEDGYDNANPGFPPHVYVDIETNGCQAGQGSTLSVAVISSAYYNQLQIQSLTTPGLSLLLNMFGGNDTVAFQALYHVGPGTPQPAGYNTTSDSFTVDLRAGETNCASIAGYDCQYFFLVYGNNGAIAHLAGTGAAPELEYDCDDGECLDAWSGGGIIPFGQTTDLPGNAIDPNYDSDYFSEGSELPLAPLPGVNPNTISTLGGFLKALFTVLIVIAGILAFIMIVIGGVVYATSDAFSDKSSGKEMILNAILGLIIALGSWVILNTINPNLASNLSITVPKVTLDQANYQYYETPLTGQGGNSGFTLAGTFDTPQTSPGLSAFLGTITDTNPISSITVNTGTPSMTIASTSGAFVTIPVTGLGYNGVAEVGAGQEGDRKTPKGNWQISSDIRIAGSATDASVSSNAGFNMGPAFIGTNISAGGNVRGIGIHGNSSNNPGSTMGCVRLKNDDVLALARKVTSGISLIIQ